MVAAPARAGPGDVFLLAWIDPACVFEIQATPVVSPASPSTHAKAVKVRRPIAFPTPKPPQRARHVPGTACPVIPGAQLSRTAGIGKVIRLPKGRPWAAPTRPLDERGRGA
jgi:hypothetical protein